MTLQRIETLRLAVEGAFERRHQLDDAETASLMPLLDEGLMALDAGLVRAALVVDDQVQVQTWVKKLILLCFVSGRARRFEGFGLSNAYDKLPLKFDGWSETDFAASEVRVVPGAVVRRGAYIAPGVVLMPSFVNIGASIGRSTMIDTWATIGSCAQVGAYCHISGGAGIGGVLEPLGHVPVVIEDHVFVGARSEIAEGVRVRQGAVIGMGVYLGQSTPVIDRASGLVYYGEVPENAVVISGVRHDPLAKAAVSTYAAVIVKYADEKTRGKTALNFDVRDRE